MTKSKQATFGELTHSFKLLGEALVETATLRTAFLLERLGLLAPPPRVPKTRRGSRRKRAVS